MTGRVEVAFAAQFRLKGRSLERLLRSCPDVTPSRVGGILPELTCGIEPKSNLVPRLKTRYEFFVPRLMRGGLGARFPRCFIRTAAMTFATQYGGETMDPLRN